MQKYVTVGQLAERYGVGIATIWRWVRAGNLPRPHKLSAGCTRWAMPEIEQFEADREAEAKRA